MVRHTLKILQQMLQDFKSVSDHFRTLCIKGLKQSRFEKCNTHVFYLVDLIFVSCVVGVFNFMFFLFPLVYILCMIRWSLQSH